MRIIDPNAEVPVAGRQLGDSFRKPSTGEIRVWRGTAWSSPSGEEAAEFRALEAKTGAFADPKATGDASASAVGTLQNVGGQPSVADGPQGPEFTSDHKELSPEDIAKLKGKRKGKLADDKGAPTE
jgi:hypothetical protein